MTEQEKLEKIFKITTDVLNLPAGSLKGKSRMMKLCLGREIAGIIALKNGVHRLKIAKALGKNRTATYYYEREHQSKLQGWMEYAKAYTEVTTKYEKIIGDKKVFVENTLLRKHIKNAGLKNSKNPRIIFTIECGKTKYKLLSDYSNFSNDYDTLKNCLTEYNYKLNWQEI
ncbi:MAG: hypothetical protein Unbinned7837contig1000_33 [Prokaryotic dsDNA virus sp.]|nr:MAG: hypothetical protein Unbinned7837contig1000_33 [Prokaryotic dsDNA virus sp.]|tara:strand:- start:9617 stop:10129 length:513 start_codon:yes stop_codon:yes gene_type:complete